MSFFGKRKIGGQLRTLSEKEIQDKLYGSFRVHEQVRFEPAPPPSPAKQKPVTLQPPHAAPSVSSKELFTTVQEIPAPKIDPSPSRPQLEKKLKEERLSSLSEWADEEEVESKIKAARLGWEASQKAREFKAPRPERRPLLKPLQDSLRAAAESFIDSLSAFIRSIQFRPADMRRLGYFLAGFSIVLFFLFVINFLNVRRETAMKMPRPPAHAAATEGSAGAVSQASAKATPLSPADQEPSASSSLHEGEGAYVIQVSTYAGEGDAKRLLTQVHEQKLPGFIKALQRANAKIYYVVFLGRFKTYQEAQKSLSDFQKKDIAKPFRDAFVRTL